MGVGTDDFMIRRKNRTSILSYEQRVEIVKAIRYVDEVVPENDLDKIAEYSQASISRCLIERSLHEN